MHKKNANITIVCEIWRIGILFERYLPQRQHDTILLIPQLIRPIVPLWFVHFSNRLLDLPIIFNLKCMTHRHHNDSQWSIKLSIWNVLTLLYHTCLDVMYDLHTFPWYGAQYPINSCVVSLNVVISESAWIIPMNKINIPNVKCWKCSWKFIVWVQLIKFYVF